MLIFLGLIGLLAIIGIFIFNSLVARKNDVANAFASIDAMLKKRFDLIPNLVATIKESTKFETSTLEKVISMRSQMNSMSAQQKAQLDKDTSSALKSIMVQVEAYPDLKSSQNFIQLQNALQEIEDQLAAARRTYNASVTIYNNALEMFPSNIVAGLLHYQRQDLLSIPEEEKKNVNIGTLFQ